MDRPGHLDRKLVIYYLGRGAHLHRLESRLWKSLLRKGLLWTLSIEAGMPFVDHGPSGEGRHGVLGVVLSARHLVGDGVFRSLFHVEVSAYREVVITRRNSGRG